MMAMAYEAVGIQITTISTSRGRSFRIVVVDVLEDSRIRCKVCPVEVPAPMETRVRILDKARVICRRGRDKEFGHAYGLCAFGLTVALYYHLNESYSRK